ncbi:MAG TPA: lecithin retinol acyltransferase family protein [Flavobacteriales bacterium]|nr:lecithin retinol acyltransferase family protein [Flavobacteriales bacterium]
MKYSTQLALHYGLGIGDRMVVPKSLADMVRHHVVFIGYSDDGDAWIAENKVGVGVVQTRLDHFLASVRSIHRIERFQGNDEARRRLVERALARMGRSYNAVKYNCEHFVNDVVAGKVSSHQVGTALGVLGLLALVVVATRR